MFIGFLGWRIKQQSADAADGRIVTNHVFSLSRPLSLAPRALFMLSAGPVFRCARPPALCCRLLRGLVVCFVLEFVFVSSQFAICSQPSPAPWRDLFPRGPLASSKDAAVSSVARSLSVDKGKDVEIWRPLADYFNAALLLQTRKVHH